MKKTCLTLLMAAFAVQLLRAQVSKVSLLTASPVQYAKTEWDIRLIAHWDNPYLQEDVALDMLLTSPSGKKLILPCYYESGGSGRPSAWKARFAAQEKGRYSYKFRLSEGGKVISISKQAGFYSSASQKNGFLHPRDNWTFQFDSGKPFRGIGENIAWESRKNDDSKFFETMHENSKYNYEYMLRSLAAHGGNFYRTWISSFNLPIDWKNGFNSNRYTATDKYFNPSAIVKMDRLVALSDSLGVYMMLMLGEGAYSVKEGGFSPTEADFFVSPKSKQRYKNRLRYIIARWGYSASIAAWELFNEVDNVQFSNPDKPISADSIVQWHDEMSTYIKQTDPYNHLVTTSISHRDLKGLNSLITIDFNQKHIYKNTAGIPAAIVQYENDFKKPYVIGEYGYEWDWSKNFDEFASGMDSDFKRGLWYGLFSPTPILPMSWWWEYFDNRKTDAYILKIRAIYDEMMAAGKGSFKPVQVISSNPQINTYGVKCGRKIFIYAFNPDSTAQSVSLEAASDIKPGAEAVVYDCESGVTKNAYFSYLVDKQQITNWKLTAKTDVVFVISSPAK